MTQSFLEVVIHLQGNTIVIDDQASVTFNPRNKDKTFNAIIDKCCELEKSFVTGSEELKHLRQNIELQLTLIYQEYESTKCKKTAVEVQQVNERVNEPEIVVPVKEWQECLVWHYGNLRTVTQKHFPTVWPSLEFILSVVRILNIKNCNLPFMGIILGKPSSFKTFGIELCRGTPHTFYSDGFTAKSFVSHNSGVAAELLAEIDLLPKIKNKIFLTPELAPTFSAREEDLVNIFGIITRILDGHGYESDSGAQGHRGYTGEFHFVWLGAVVEIPRKVHKLLSTLGPKLYFMRLDAPEQKENEYLAELQDDKFHQKRLEIYQALVEYLKWFTYCPKLEREGPLLKLEWGADDKKSLRFIIRLAKLLAHLRGSVPTWESRDTQGADYAYSVATIEEPSRAITQLRNLARGHALSQGRNQIDVSDLSMVAKVVLSTAPIERVFVFDLLLAYKGALKTSQITEGMNVSNPTAKRTMAEFKALGLADMLEPSSSNTELCITLKDDFNWFLSEEFSLIRYGLPLKEKSPPHSNEIIKRLGQLLDLNEDITVRGGQNSFSKVQPEDIECPYCAKCYKTTEEVINHSIRTHPKRPVTAELTRMETEI